MSGWIHLLFSLLFLFAAFVPSVNPTGFWRAVAQAWLVFCAMLEVILADRAFRKTDDV